MIRFNLIKTALLVALALSATAIAASSATKQFTDTFGVSKAELSSVGTNRFFVLSPGYCEVLVGQEDGRPTVLTISVLNETKVVDGVETRIAEEREVSRGQTVEVSRNYFAISRRTTDVFYFGEDSVAYKHGQVISHEGSWLAGVAGAHFGLAMPGTPLLGARYQQEIAPGVAMDRARIISLSATVETPAGRFANCLETAETSGIEPGTEYKRYVAGIGLVQDSGLKVKEYGYRTP